MEPRVLVLNGPNLNLLGEREPAIYGHERLVDIEERCVAVGSELGLRVQCRQSNHEGRLVDWIQEARAEADALILNPGAYGHTSIAILDALQAFEGSVVEVHLSNIHRREAYRHATFSSKAATGVICGLGREGYLLALRAVASRVTRRA